ncbi:MAG: class I SAM-dependent methyltransferase [Bacteroidota bacterium]
MPQQSIRRYITKDDFLELRAKIVQRGGAYLLSKLNPSAVKRTQSTFGESSFQHANWWIIPAVRRRWNQLVTSDPNVIYEDYFVQKYLSGKQNLKVLSLGCGIGSHERNLAKHNVFTQIDAYDIAPNLIDRANQIARAEGLSNIQFHCADVNAMDLEQEAYNLIFFHSSLHHFLHLDQLISHKLPKALKPNGYLLLNDYWGPDRLQWTPAQLNAINQLLPTIPEQYRVRFQSTKVKNSVSGPGWLRMRLSDPSEAAEASQIEALLRASFTTLEEKPIGGNILMPLLKDIAHHFADDQPEGNAILEELFQAEDVFIKNEKPLLFFGVYRKRVIV